MIDGNTTLIAHLGYPTATFRAPLIYNPYFQKIGVNAVVVPMGVKADNYPEVLRALFRLTNIRGALVTMPHKIATVALMDEVSAASQIAGACNAILRRADGTLYGDLFDGEGFVRGVLGKGRQIAGARALVVGSGGAGSAIAAALAEKGAGWLGLFDVDRTAAERLASRLRGHYPTLALEVGSKDPQSCDIIVNATPLGMEEGDPLPVDVARIAAGSLVADVVMKQEITPFLAAARSRGCMIQVGTDMLFEQIPAYLEFFGFPPATAAELRAIARIRH